MRKVTLFFCFQLLLKSALGLVLGLTLMATFTGFLQISNLYRIEISIFREISIETNRNSKTHYHNVH